ncbi:MAG: outer membrane lipoprotein carrier protein LolA [Leptospirillia bacterium]
MNSALRRTVFAFFTALLPVSLSFTTVLAEESPSSRHELSLLVAKVKTGEGFRAHFTQTLAAPGAPKTLSRGNLVYRAPGLMLLRYTAPEGQWLKLDGNRMALYVPQNRQVLIKTIKKHRIPETPAILLASIPQISHWFFVKPIESGSVPDGTPLSIVLIPRHPDPHLAQATLTLRKGTGQLIRLLFMEQNGTRLSIRLDGFTVLSRVPASDLHVSVPPGTTAAKIPGAF